MLPKTSPANTPSQTKPIFQMAVPSVVSTRIPPVFIFIIPVGVKMRHRTIGINRQKNTAAIPFAQKPSLYPLDTLWFEMENTPNPSR